MTHDLDPDVLARARAELSSIDERLTRQCAPVPVIIRAHIDAIALLMATHPPPPGMSSAGWVLAISTELVEAVTQLHHDVDNARTQLAHATTGLD